MLQYLMALSLIYVPMNEFIPKDYSPTVIVKSLRKHGCNIVYLENITHDIDVEGPPQDGKVKLVKMITAYQAAIWNFTEECWMTPDGGAIFNKIRFRYYLDAPEDQIDDTGHFCPHDDPEHAEILQRQ